MKRASGLASLSALAIVGATATGIAMNSSGEGDARLTQVAAPSATSATSTGTFRAPTYLPPGVRLSEQQDQGAGRILTYSIDGAANADKRSSANPHPASTLQIIEVPGNESLLPPADDYNLQKAVTIGSVRGTLTYPSTGLGIYRLDWVDDGLMFTASVSVIATSDGRSGFSLGELQKVANSLSS